MKKLLILLALVPTTVQIGTEVMCRRIPPIPVDVAQSKCLAVTIYGEARGESERGQIAVAYTVKNRAVKKTLCQVALAHKQYSIFNDNPELRSAALSPHLEPHQKNHIDRKSWQKAVQVANAVMQGTVKDPTMGSTHYLSPTGMVASGYKFPKWSKEYIKVAYIGKHVFFKKVV